MIKLKKVTLIALTAIQFIGCSSHKKKPNEEVKSAMNVIHRLIGKEKADEIFVLTYKPEDDTFDYSIDVRENKVFISGVNQVAICKGVYDYLSNACNSIVSWSGNRINIPEKLPLYSKKVKSPYKYHYYLNVVTHGYTTPYWNWERWEKEIDWMALHGLDMPLLSGAHEAILLRVFRKLGLTQNEIDSYFTGPAHLPWNRMGNITKWDGKLPESFYEKQIKLNHQILNRVKDLGMTPIVPAFAGFVPKGIKRLYPNEPIQELNWAGFSNDYKAYLFSPDSEIFKKIGSMYIAEWEKEFGKSQFYLADSFNEMDVPVSKDNEKALEELSKYGEAVFRSINDVNPEATWVMQGWTFPFHKKDGEIFWTPERLNALMAKVPKDKLLILDLANEYNVLEWKIDPSWKTYEGFFGKEWIYSFIPNMGGKSSFNGRLDLYASMSFEALNYKNKGNLVGFGFAPEGIENNEIIYELLSEVGWEREKINLNQWIEKYAKRRYGNYSEKMKKAFQYFNASCFGSFESHPRHTYQFSPTNYHSGTINNTEDFKLGVKFFLECRDQFKGNKLYEADAIAYTAQYLGVEVDELLNEFKDHGEKNMILLEKALSILSDIDRLLESHPNFTLKQWVDNARSWGDTAEEKDYYESNAKRLITSWGGGELDEYAARTWSGLIRDYYMPRWKKYYEMKKKSIPFDLSKWEENWIRTSDISEIKEFESPTDKAYELILNNQ